MLKRKENALVLMSGGIDSTACAHFLANREMAVHGIFLDFGQCASVLERRAAHAIAESINIPLHSFSVVGASFSSGELVGRNAFLLHSAAFLTGLRRGLVALGVHAGTPYHDCSLGFVESMARSFAENSDGALSVVAPFVTWSKGDVFQYFMSEKLPLELTYSCEAGADPPCGLCASCLDRRAMGC